MARIVDESEFDPVPTSTAPARTRIVSEDAFDAPGQAAAPSGQPSALRAALEAAKGIRDPFTQVAKAARGLVNPERTTAMIEGLRGRPVDSEDPVAQGVNMAGRHGPSLAALAAFPPAASADLGGIAAARYLPQAGRIGFQGLRMLAGGAHAGAVTGLASLAASSAAGEPNPGEAAQTAKNFATGEAAAPALEAAIKMPWQAARWAGKKALEKSGELYSGIKPEAFQELSRIPDKVLAYARKGMGQNPLGKEVPIAQQEAQAMGRAAQESIGKASDAASASYGKMMDYLHSAPENAQRLNVGDKVANTMEPILQKQFSSWSDPEAGQLARDSKKTFDEFYGRAVRMRDTHPGKVASLMQEITEQIKAERGSQLAAALGKLKASLLDALPGEYSYGPTIDKMTGTGEEALGYNIKAERQGYAAAKQLGRDLSGFASKDDPVQAIEGAMRRGGKTSVNLTRAAGVIPELKTAIAEMPAARAGAAFAPKIGSLPRTGLMGGAMLTAGKALGGSAADAAMLPFIGLGSSPRALAETIAAGRPAANAVEGAARQAAPSLPAIIASILKSRRKGAK